MSVARTFRSSYGLTTFYVADLDAIEGGPPNIECLGSLTSEGFQLLVDAGIRRRLDAAKLRDVGVEKLVVGSETAAGPLELAGLVEDWTAERVVFSLDLKDGRPAAAHPDWKAADPLRVLDEAWECGARAMLLLDLGMVGTYNGIGSLSLAKEWIKRRPAGALLVGGGARDWRDVAAAEEAGVHGVLIGSALHDARISGEQIALTSQ